MAEMSLGNSGVQIIFLKRVGAARIAIQSQENCKLSGSHPKLPKLLNGLSATASSVIKSQDIHGETPLHTN